MYTINVSTVNMNMTPRVAVMERNAKITIKANRLADIKSAHKRAQAKKGLDKQNGI